MKEKFIKLFYDIYIKYIRKICTSWKSAVLVVVVFACLFSMNMTLDTPGADPNVDGSYKINRIQYAGTGIEIDDNLKYAKPGREVRFHVSMDKGYTLDKVVAFAGEKTVDITSEGKDMYSFIMPENNVSITTDAHIVDENGFSFRIKYAQDNQYGYKTGSMSVIYIKNESGLDYGAVKVITNDDVFECKDSLIKNFRNGMTTTIVATTKNNLNVGYYDGDIDLNILTYEDAGIDKDKAKSMTPMNGEKTIKYADKSVSVNVPLHTNVVKKDVFSIDFPSVSDISYGRVLDNIKIVAGDRKNEQKGKFSWKSGKDMPHAGTQGCEMVFTPADTKHYDYSYVSGWDNISKTITQKVFVNVRKAPLKVVIPDVKVKVGSSVPVIYQEEISCEGFVTKQDEADYLFKVINNIKPSFKEDWMKREGTYMSSYENVILDDYYLIITGGKLTVKAVDKDSSKSSKADSDIDYDKIKKELEEQKIIKVSVPTTSKIYIDPYEIDKKGQIYSDTINVVNYSKFPLRARIENVMYGVKSDGDSRKDCSLYLNVAHNDEKWHQLLSRNNFKGMKDTKLAAYKSGKEPDKLVISLNGAVSDGSQDMWMENDIKLYMVFTFTQW